MFDELTVWNMQTLHPERIEYTPRDASQPLPYTEYDDPGERLGLNEHPEDVADERGEPPADDDEREA